MACGDTPLRAQREAPAGAKFALDPGASPRHLPLVVLNTCLLLAAALWLAWLARAHHWAAAAAVLAAALAGTLLPDLDLAFGLGHRSGLTHSVLPPALLAWSRRYGRPAAAGLALGIGLHLSADLFPHAMRGFATIKLPGVHGIDATASYAWIVANGAIAFGAGSWLVLRTVPRALAAAVLAGVALIGLSYLQRADGGWWALALLLPLGWLATRPYRRALARHPAPAED